MNEQDIMNKINEETKNIPIPDSISPEAMKKMLDETVKQNTSPKNTSITSNRRRLIRGLSAAACMVIVVSGAWGITTRLKTDNSTAMMSDSGPAYEDEAAVESEDTATEVASDNAIADIAATADSTNSKPAPVETTVISESSFHAPKNYEDFYQAAVDSEEKAQREYNRLFSSRKSIKGIQSDTRLDAIAEETEDVVEDYSMDSADKASSVVTSDAETNRSDTANTSEDYSKTNTQESTIDEGDIVKTDGSYIYRYTTDSDSSLFQIHIIKADNGKMQKESIIDSINLPDFTTSQNIQFQEFYLQDNKIILLYTAYNYLTPEDATKTYICTYDVSDKKQPKCLGTVTQSGDYNTSRISDGYLYTISTFNTSSFYDKKNYNAYVPKVNNDLISCEDIFYCEDYLMKDNQIITAIDINQPDAVANTVSIPIQSGNVYVSENAIYIYNNRYYWSSSTTQIMKIFYQNGSFIIGSETSFNGYLYGPFAINEYSNYLRIVATVPANNPNKKVSVLDRLTKSGSAAVIDVTTNTSEVTNALYVLDSNLKLCGSISNIAPGEQVYSARFLGDIGYFVTYRNTDPLFSVDLSNPSNPTLIGALKIPGFSSYLHPYGDGILLGFGEETDPNSQRFMGLKLSMFNTNDPSNVTEEDKYVIEDSEYSDALTNYKAMMIDTNKNLFGFSYLDYVDYTEHFHFATYSYDETYGFVETGKYNIDDLISNPDAYYTTYDTIRGVFIGNYLYISSNTSIISYPLYKDERVDQLQLSK